MRIVALSLAAVLVAGFSDFVQAQHHTARFFTSYGSPRELSEVAFSPTSEHLAVAVKGGPLIVIATATGDVAREFDFQPHTMNWSRDGKRLLAIGERGTKFLNLASGAVSAVQWRLPAGQLGFRLKEQLGKLVVEALIDGGPAAESGKIRVGDELIGVIVSGREKSLLGRPVADALKELGGPAGTPVTLQIVPKGSSKHVDIELRRKWGTQEGNRLVFRDVRGGSSPEACIVAMQSSLVLLDANSGEVVSMLQPVEVGLRGLNVVSPDGRLLAQLAPRANPPKEEPNLGLEIYDVQRQARTQFAVYDGDTPRVLAFSPDGRRVLIADYDRVEVYDLEQKAFVKPILVGFDPDQVAGRPANDAPLINVLPDFGTRTSSRIRSETRLIYSGDVSRDGRIVAVGSPHAQCLLWSTERHKCLATFGDAVEKYTSVEHTRISPDSRWVAYFIEGTLNVVGVQEHVAAESAAAAPAVDSK